MGAGYVVWIPGDPINCIGIVKKSDNLEILYINISLYSNIYIYIHKGDDFFRIQHPEHIIEALRQGMVFGNKR